MSKKDPKQFDGTNLIKIDPWLEKYRSNLQMRHSVFLDRLEELEKTAGSLEDLALGHKYFGFNRGECDGVAGVWYREWAPEAFGLFLTGDFNQWNRYSNPLVKDVFGVWSVFLSDEDYADKLIHGTRVKVHVVTKNGRDDRIPAYIKRVERETDSPSFTGVYWQPETVYEWKHKAPKINKGLRIYEAHVGMAQEEGKIGSFDEFRENVLPRIKKQGYNVIQLMAVKHHPYYASFGYQIGSFFAVSSYLGTPEDLKRLIDEAHNLGMMVLLDLVHSHAIKNIDDGLNLFDGSDHQYFHEGVKGEHEAWDTKLFNYSKYEVIRFLLSNVRYWMEEFRFDGFRFDGVTSMLYLDHGLGREFDHYDMYFDKNVDDDALVYLKLANLLVHRLNEEAVTVAEDMSGMPGTARPISEGGLGFDYRLAMGIPDNWIKLLKERNDENWHMGNIFKFLRNRRAKEKHVAYAESHDQALVGDKTIAFWLMDKDMYADMGVEKQNDKIDRGMALHKLIRLATFGLGGEAYLNFMGNEFGHPEWVDFPREGNNDSYHYARRQWSLVDNKTLRYKYLNEFDRALHQLEEEHEILNDEFIELLETHEAKKLLIFRRGPLVFVFNFHPSSSYEGLRVGVPDNMDYEVVLSTDIDAYGGFERVKQGQKYPIQQKGSRSGDQSLQIYVPSRTAQVLRPIQVKV